MDGQISFEMFVTSFYILMKYTCIRANDTYQIETLHIEHCNIVLIDVKFIEVQ